MGPINYAAQFVDPSRSAYEGYATGLNLQGSHQALRMNDAAEARAMELHPLAVAGAELGMDAQAQGMALATEQNNRANNADARATTAAATAQAQAAEQQQRKAAFQADMAALAQMGAGATAADYAAVGAKYPEFAGAINETWDGLDDARKSGMTEVMGQAVTALRSGNTNRAISLLDEYATAAENSGDKAAAATARGLMQSANASPEAALAAIGMTLQTVDPDMASKIFGGGNEEPAEVRSLRIRAEQAGLVKGTPEYENFMLNGGGAPANFRALEMQAEAAGLVKGTPEYAEFMETRGAGAQAGAKTTATNEANIATGGEAAEAVSAGRARGTASVATDRETAEMERNLPGLREVVDQLYDLSSTATFTRAGRLRDAARRSFGLPAGEGAVDRASYIAVVDNQILPLLRQTFGAAFTAAEGDRLRATLGDPNASPEEKHAKLEAFIAQAERNLIARGGTVPDAPPTDETDSWMRFGNE